MRSSFNVTPSKIASGGTVFVLVALHAAAAVRFSFLSPLFHMTAVLML
jgi:hypothetical protein